MKRLSILLTAVLGIALALPTQAKEWPGFTRGMGIGGWLTNYKRFNVLPMEKRLLFSEGDFEHFETYITEKDVANIKSMGFDHIRLGFDQIVLEESPGKYRERTFRKVDDFVRWCAKYDLGVVLNLHKAIGNYCDIAEDVSLMDDTKLQDRFIALWLEFERRYHDQPRLVFELLNEVRDVDPEKWNSLADRAIKAIRAKNPNRWIVVGPTCWNNPPKLPQLKVWDDPHVVYTFHMYWPHEFTHQRGVLQSSSLAYNRELEYPCADIARYNGYYKFHGWGEGFTDGKPMDRARLEAHMKPCFDWVKAHPDKILWNGEFGTIRHAPKASRVAYMRDVVSLCKEHGIPWSVWNYLSTPNDGNRFSLVDDDTRKILSPALLAACLGEDSVQAIAADAPRLELGALFQDHAVVQRDKRVAVWGKGAKPFARLNATLGKVKGATRAAADGSFMFRLAPQPAGGPYVLEVKDESGRAATASDIYVGEVWIGSGQSNMEFRMRTCVPGADSGDHSLIRQFTVGIEGAFRPVAEPRGTWTVATEKTLPDFSGVGYFFAQELQKQFPGVAVGIVLSALGGTSVMSWSSRSCLMANPYAAALVEKYEQAASDVNAWDTTPQPVMDAGPAEVEAKGWAGNGFDDSEWKKVTLPNWNLDKKVFGRIFNGATWFRKRVMIPKRWEGRELLLLGGRVDKHDRIYLGGELVGASGFGFDEHFWNVLRCYRIPAAKVKAGETVVAIRCWSHQLGFGVHGQPEDLSIAPLDDPKDVLPLAGEWRAAIERDLGRVVFGGTALPGNTGAPYALYDAAIAPLVPYTIRGFLWYQGGNDVGRAGEYRALQTAMIRDWRRAWGEGDLPFVLTLQAGIRARSGKCQASCALADMREAQIGSCDDLPNVGVVSTVDIGCVDDGHPKNKLDVGKRMCAWAMKTAYGRKSVDGESPRISAWVIDGKAVRIRFHHAGSGLRTKAGTAAEVGCCAVQDKSGKWHDAKGRIDGDSLLISSPEVDTPVHARYAWTSYPDETANLENNEGLPCLPFRTDAAK